MRVIGVISELNPFTQGHASFLRQARELCRADYVIAVMSGDFVQRGEPAVTDKLTRAEMAVRGGADLVLELPLRFATASAGDFAEGAVRLLDSLHICSALAFGVESGALCTEAEMTHAAGFLRSESESCSAAIREGLRQGLSYPAAVSAAVHVLPEKEQRLFRFPNASLGLQYCSALLKTGSGMQPVMIPRQDDGISAHRVRHMLLQGKPADASRLCPDYLAPETADLLSRSLSGCTGFPEPDWLSLPLTEARLLNDSASHILDLSPWMENRLRKLPLTLSFPETATALKTKNVTMARVKRALLHKVLDLKNISIPENLPYAEILAVRKSATALLRILQNTSSAALITKRADYHPESPGDAALWQADVRASDLYLALIRAKLGPERKDEMRSRPIIVPDEA